MFERALPTFRPHCTANSHPTQAPVSWIFIFVCRGQVDLIKKNCEEFSEVLEGLDSTLTPLLKKQRAAAKPKAAKGKAKAKA